MILKSRDVKEGAKAMIKTSKVHSFQVGYFRRVVYGGV